LYKGNFSLEADLMIVKRVNSVITATLLIVAFFNSNITAQDNEDKSILNVSYESWRTSRKGDTVIYRIIGQKEGPDRVIKKITDRTLDKIDYQVSYYSGSRLLEEETRQIVLKKDLKKRVSLSGLKKKGIRVSNTSLTFRGTLYKCVKYVYPDGKEEIYSPKIPAGALLNRKGADGKILEELVEIRMGSATGLRISQIGKKTGSNKEIKTGAFSVSELMKGMKHEKKPVRSKKKSMVISFNSNAEKKNAGEFQNYIEEAKENGGNSAKQFLDNSTLLVYGFDKLHARVKYHVIESIQPQESDDLPIPATLSINYEKFIVSKKKTIPHRGVFNLEIDGETSVEEIALKVNPYPEMAAFEFNSEAVSILPGSFNCFRIRLVSPEPVTVVEEKDGIEIKSIIEKKIDYWISVEKGCQIVVKKIETEKEKITETPVDGTDSADFREIIRTKKMTLIEFIPPEK
jgi:hypothetical protein